MVNQSINEACEEIIKLFTTSTKIWAYASHFNGWWCYDKDNNNKLNKIYDDYCMRNGIYTNKESNKTKKIVVDNDDELEILSDVDFENTSDDTSHIPDTPIDYSININNTAYKIDIRQMKQTNIINDSRSRKIMFFETSSNIKNNNDIINYLKSKNIVGISGKKI